MIAGNAEAQIKIGTNGATIAPSSLLELESTNQGLLLPRMADTVAINALAPPNGMLIYLTKAPAVGLYVRKVTGWEYLTGSLGGAGNFSSLTVSGTVTAGSFTGPLNGNATSANTAINATNSANSTVINDLATPAPVYPTFVTTTPGNSQLRTATTKLSFIPNTGILTATGFAGPLTGDVTGNATSATNATNASNTDILNEVVSGAIHYPTFVSGTAGNLPHMVSNPGLNYVPSTGTLSATRFAGTFIGNASTATNAVTTTITNDNTSASTVYPTFVTASSGNMGQRTSDARLTFVPATGNLTASILTSTVPTGGAPLIVASTTPVANLTSTNTLNTAVTDDVATAVPVYPTFVTATTGYQNQRTSSSRLSFIPSTGALTANSFVGPLNGNATSANTAINATNSANSNITDDIVTPTTAYPVFVNASPGNQPLRVGPSNLSYVPSTGILTARGFVGPLTGNVTGTATAALDAQRTVEIQITDDVISNTPIFPTMVTNNTGTLPARVSSTKLSFIPSTGELTAPIFRGSLSGNASSATSLVGMIKLTSVPAIAPVIVTSGQELDVNYTVTGAAPTGTVVVSPNPALPAGLGIMSARITTAGVVTVRYRNFNGSGSVSAGAINLTVIQ